MPRRGKGAMGKMPKKHAQSFTMKPIELTGVKPHNPAKPALGYAVCRQWRDNPRNVEVVEYADTDAEAKAMIRKLARDDTRYVWFVGVYQ